LSKNQQKEQLSFRQVDTRVSEFSPLGRLFTLLIFLITEEARIFGPLFSTVKAIGSKFGGRDGIAWIRVRVLGGMGSLSTTRQCQIEPPSSNLTSTGVLVFLYSCSDDDVISGDDVISETFFPFLSTKCFIL
jgi:hypothetical protein